MGLRRAGWPREQITEMRKAFRDLLRAPMDREEQVAECRRRAVNCPGLNDLAQFIVESKERKRGICPGHGKVPRNLATWLGKVRRGKTTFAGLAEAEDDE